MAEKFENQPEEKQQQILNAAFQEFGEHGYHKASTNRIVEAAGIGKGMLFYYFKSKKKLFDYVLSYAFQIIEGYTEQIDMSIPDVIARYEEASRIKMKTYLQHTEIFHFFGNLLLNFQEDLPEEWQKKIGDLQIEMKKRMFSGIDYSLFRKDIDPETALKLIFWSIEGFERELLAQLRGVNFEETPLDPIWDSFFHYLEALRKAYYEERGH
ncbi:TetR/AcrR family transcriptional regulator [Alkalicoccus halolimnae]|uniref:TetR/AcrR family transcriptional regulator n=1 Tax=Alkalicoccus halolimnae TaxID=1667239 RepID=A0A5C7F6C2_9BACI|nr:TetR/AcrR family transcriptional regulator [Alkalicoccus halolimnae]TXF86232.1 TetR/AcrR family transcriptional regulator [Alkalicoccus halolimnae]